MRINIPENRGESGMYHSDIAAYKTRPPISSASALQMSGRTDSALKLLIYKTLGQYKN